MSENVLNTGLYRLSQKERRAAAELFGESFQQDPLYLQLIPQAELRAKILPELFDCYLTMYRSCFELYADSQDLNGVIAIIDGTQPHCHWASLFQSAAGGLRTLWMLVKMDPSLATLRNFIRGRAFLSSSWEGETKELENPQEIVRIDLLAVRAEKRGSGIAGQLMRQVLAYADDHNCYATLETRNRKNVDLYRRFGFHTIRVLDGNSTLRQYCMVR